MEKRVLIVDDEAVFVTESRRLVRDYGVTVDVARTMEEADTLLKVREYKWIIIGAQGPGGLESDVFRQMKENRETTGIILLIGRGGTQSTQQALAIGASYYYEKSVSAKILRDVLRDWVGNADSTH